MAASAESISRNTSCKDAEPWIFTIFHCDNSWGYSKLFFENLHAYITNAFSKIAVSLGDINGNWVQRLIAYDTGESLGGYDRTFVSSNLFTINSANGNYYLILEVDSGATSRGLNATIEMNGCYLI